MVSFSCEVCGDIVTKKNTDKHRNQCRGASFTCLDCMVPFQGTDYRSHTSCISEAQKYQGKFYREKEKSGKGDKRRSMNGTNYHSQAMVPRHAYVEDAPEGENSQMVELMMEVPPRAPTPPSAAAPVGDNVNVFDFLVNDATPNGSKTAINAPDERRMIEHAVHYGNGSSQLSPYPVEGSQYFQYGFSYGNAPVEPTISRYDSWQNLTDSQHSQALMPPPYVTPLPKEQRRERRDRHAAEMSDKKRKRHQIDELDLSSTKRPSSQDETMVDAPSAGRGSKVLHSGLTGGLNKLVTDPEFYEDRIEAGPTPILSPIKRSRRETDEKKDRRKSSYVAHGATSKPSWGNHRSRSVERTYHEDKHRRRTRSADRKYHDDKHRKRNYRESVSSEDRPRRKQMKAIEYPDRPSSVQPNATNQLISYNSRADLFLSFITKGPASERGCSINKVLKRYHRERNVRSEDKEEEDKELWRSLRLRRNENGEIVLFI